MSHKFFTWTKGDRRNATEALKAGGIVPIPVECITIKGMEYARHNNSSSKAGRKPIPLSFEPSPAPSTMHSGRTNDSIALHDAAVQSATSLMHAMNDMLRSPQLSAHLSAQQRTGGLAPMHGRPRSRTAPSTPLAEAPFMEPVELPGSMPAIPTSKSFSSLHQSIDLGGTRPPAQSPLAMGLTIERPHTSPRETTYNLPAPCRQPSITSSYATAHDVLPETPLQKKRSTVRRTSHQVEGYQLPEKHEDTLVTAEDQGVSHTRPPLKVLQSLGGKAASLPGSTESLPTVTTQAPPPVTGESSLQLEHTLQTDAEAALMHQISLLRTSHEAHLASLKEAHEKELVSNRAYIAFLESRRTPIQSPPQNDKQQHLTLDTSHAGMKGLEPVNSSTSATTLQSFDSSLENQKRVSQEAIAEAEALKRKLSLARKAQIDSSELRRERDLLRDAADRSDRRIFQLKDIVRKAKGNEKMLRNMTTDLEARLLDANNARNDVLEGYHEACGIIRKLTEREGDMKKEVEELRSRLVYKGGRHASDTTLALPLTADSRAKHHRTASDVGGMAPLNDPFLTTVHDLKRLVAEKDARIAELHESTKRVPELEAALREHQHRLAKSETDCERYNSLLHNELRRQSKYAVMNSHTTSRLDSEALFGVAEKSGPKTQTASDYPDTPLSRTGGSVAADAKVDLEREMKRCFEEIIMYKLDIRGYKKDIKKAQAEIESLKAIHIPHPPTPDRDSSSSAASSATKPNQSSRSPTLASDGDPSSGGLGISWPAPQRPSTPPQSIASATALALTRTTPSTPAAQPLRSHPPSFLSSPPPSRPKTPLGSHKRLPKPPPSSRTPSPLLPPAFDRTPGRVGGPKEEVKMQRAETLRSLSESIISSYGKRSGNWEQQAGGGFYSGLTPPTPAVVMGMGRKGRSSDPPLSKFASSVQ